jgi:cytochrome c oxidase subunit 2
MIVRRVIASAAWLAGVLGWTGGAMAQADGVSREWQMGFQDPASPIMQDIVRFHDYILILITAISLLVLGVLIYVVWRFNAKANPVPSKNTHNTTLEVIWTVIPTVILTLMVIPSFQLLYKADVVPTVSRVAELYPDVQVDGEITLKASGIQWGWFYDYPEYGVQGMEAFCDAGPDTPVQQYCWSGTEEGEERLLETNNRVVVPVDTLVRVQITSEDVIHAWAVPAFGVKVDAVPGRINETWFVATREGVFYGQCSELCGEYHGFMPIAVEVVSRATFEERIAELAAIYPAF